MENNQRIRDVKVFTKDGEMMISYYTGKNGENYHERPMYNEKGEIDPEVQTIMFKAKELSEKETEALIEGEVSDEQISSDSVALIPTEKGNITVYNAPENAELDKSFMDKYGRLIGVGLAGVLLGATIMALAKGCESDKNHEILPKPDTDTDPVIEQEVETIKYLGKNTNLPSLKNDIHKSRLEKFKKFNENVIFSKEVFYINDVISEEYSNKFDYVIMGSDQIWNFTFASIFSEKVFASFVPKHKRISFSASFGVDYVPEKDSEAYKICKENIIDINAISVREDAGKDIIKELTGRTDVEVLIDPTMMLAKEEWEKVMKKPENLKTDKFILKSFLGNTSEDCWQEICRIAKENDCEIIDISDEDSPYYDMGPAEFLYLEKNAFLVATDSFHSCVFSILFSTPFVVFKRDDDRVKSMYSRIETLLKTFQIENRIFKDVITEDILDDNYEQAHKILDTERKKVTNFLEKNLI